MTKFSSFCLTLVILFLGFKAAIVVAVSAVYDGVEISFREKSL